MLRREGRQGGTERNCVSPRLLVFMVVPSPLEELRVCQVKRGMVSMQGHGWMCACWLCGEQGVARTKQRQCALCISSTGTAAHCMLRLDGRQRGQAPCKRGVLDARPLGVVQRVHALLHVAAAYQVGIDISGGHVHEAAQALHAPRQLHRLLRGLPPRHRMQARHSATCMCGACRLNRLHQHCMGGRCTARQAGLDLQGTPAAALPTS